MLSDQRQGVTDSRAAMDSVSPLEMSYTEKIYSYTLQLCNQIRTNHNFKNIDIETIVTMLYELILGIPNDTWISNFMPKL